jgi:hypothetical protein
MLIAAGANRLVVTINRDYKTDMHLQVLLYLLGPSLKQVLLNCNVDASFSTEHKKVRINICI